MKLKQILTVVLISAATTVGTIYTWNRFSDKPIQIQVTDNGKAPVNYTGFHDSNNASPGQPVDFEMASQSAVPAVVHITTVIGKNEASNNLPKRRNPFADIFGDDFFDFGPQFRNIPQRASGSGVLISEDGYIVTNNHVIDEADDIKVTLHNKKSYKAKLIGTDPSSDLAIIKIEEKGLPFLLYGNSDDVKLGQWVLAIGYPLNLETTVTAGIISAKARNLGLNRSKSATPIESFIQTDAAVNQGNSGGALVNTDGQLVGIVSAIASPTGAYAGYSYAIPVNIVKKIINDLLQFGAVQRAYLGISYLPDEIPDSEKQKIGYKDGVGVYVRDVAKDGAAVKSGIKSGDYITKINGTKVISGSEMVEQIARYKPGDKISVTYNREGKEVATQVTLKNGTGTYEAVTANLMDRLGASFESVDKKVVGEYGYEGGVKITDLDDNGALLQQNPPLKKGFVIVRVAGKPVKNVDEFRIAIENAGNSATLEGFYPGYDGIYVYSINDLNELRK